MQELSFIDLFAGAGGLSEGLVDAGFRGLFASEIQPVYAETYRYNHPQTVVQTIDIRELDAHHVMQDLGLCAGQLDLLAGGPPCQGFSINAPKRSSEDQRNHLFRDFLRFTDVFAPRAVLIENVPGLVSFENGHTLDAILQSLEDLGYGTGVKILGAPYYGVPQTRWRTVILGLRNAKVPDSLFPLPQKKAPVRVNFTQMYHGKPLVLQPPEYADCEYTSVEAAISDLPPLLNGERGEDVKDYLHPPDNAYQRRIRKQSTGVTNHAAPRLAQINMKRISYIRPGGNWTDIPEDLLPNGMQRARKSDHTKRYGRVAADGLASTILTKCDPHWGAYIHYNQDRCFTVREAARLQSFPDRYYFTGSSAEQYAQVGNAVPPMLAEAVGRGIYDYLKEN